MTTRDELVVALAGRYVLGSRMERGRMLDEFAALTRHHRKHAMRLLGAELERGGFGPRPERRVYDQATRTALIVIWEASDRIWGCKPKWPKIPPVTNFPDLMIGTTVRSVWKKRLVWVGCFQLSGFHFKYGKSKVT